MDINIISWFANLLMDVGFTSVFVAIMMYFWFKYFNKKLFSTENIQKARDINDALDAKENIESKIKIGNVQKYLESHKEEIFNTWVDRYNIFLMHNWTRAGHFHYIYYSLISWISKSGLEDFSNTKVKMDRVPYYALVAYEKHLLGNNWEFFTNKIEGDVWISASAIAEDLWTKSLYVKWLTDINWEYIWLIFASSVFDTIEKKPNLDIFNDNVRALLVNN